MSSFESQLKEIVEHLKKELSHLRTGRASTAIIEDIRVELYGTQQPLKHVAQLTIQDAQTLLIQPFDPNAVKAIETAFELSDTGLNPSADKGLLRLSLPPMTQERREELVDQVGEKAEEARVSVRHAREAAMKSIKQSSELSDDDKRSQTNAIQKQVEKANKEIEELAEAKEQDVLSM